MLSRGARIAAFFLGVSAIAVSTGSSAQQRKRQAQVARLRQQPDQRDHHLPWPVQRRPPPAMARPAAPPAMARPAAPAFRAAPAPQRPAMAPHAAPRIAAPPRPAAPRIAAPRPEIHRAAPPQRPAMTTGRPSRASPHHRARAHRPPRARDRRERNRSKRVRSSVSSASSSDSKSCRSGSVTCCRARAQSGRAASIACSSACSNCSRKSRKACGRNARRNGCCRRRTACSSASSACSRAIRHACSGWDHRLRLNDPPLCGCRAGGARGRFAAQFRSNDALQARAALTARENGWAPRHAWRRGHRAAFVAWLGPVFWPYAYSDIFSYTFWPTAYDPGYWAYAYDDFVDTVFWGTDSPYSAYARYPEPGAAITDYRARGRASVSPQTLRQLCADPDKGVTAWPIAEITRAVQPTPEQRALLDELKAAAAKAADVFKESCVDSYAMTPTRSLAGDDEPRQRNARRGKDRTAGTRAVSIIR